MFIINKIKDYWREIFILLGLAFAIMYFFDPKTEEVEVPIRVEVPVPVIEKEFVTVYKPKPYPIYLKGEVIKEIDSSYYKKYKALKNEKERDSLFKDAIKINTYKEKVEDDTITINLNMKVRGKLLNYQVGYKTKPRSIPLDTIIKVFIPTQNKFFYGVSAGMPIIKNPTLGVVPVAKADLYWKTKGDILINTSIDSEKRVWVGLAWEF